MILSYETNDIIHIPENKLYCWQEVLVERIHQQLKHTIVRDMFCCITLKASAKCGHLFKEALRTDFSIRVRSKYVVLKLMVGELLKGIVTGINDDGLTISFEHCHDIFVPSVTAPKTFGFDSKPKYILGDFINFRITSIRFNDNKTNRDHKSMENGTWYHISMEICQKKF